MKTQSSISFTKEGHEELRQELETLKSKRIGIIDSLRRAREMGDLSENGLYKAAKFELGNIDRRLRHISSILVKSRIVSPSSSDIVQIGCFVKIHDGHKDATYRIVGEYEGNPLDGKLSHKSPIGSKLIGRKVGEKITITTSSGETTYTLSSIHF